MLAGIESKGTIPEVLRGYFGDKSASPDWIKDSLRLVDQSKFDIEGTNYQVMYNIYYLVKNWSHATISAATSKCIHWTVTSPNFYVLNNFY